MTEATGREQSEDTLRNQEQVINAEGVIEQIRLGFGESLKARGIDTERLTQYPKDPEFWSFHWEDSAVEDPKECQRVVCQQLLESIDVLGRNHQSVRDLKRVFGLGENDDISQQDLIDLTNGGETKTQKEGAERLERKQKEEEEKRKEEERKRQDEERQRQTEQKAAQNRKKWEEDAQNFWSGWIKSARTPNPRAHGLEVGLRRIKDKTTRAHPNREQTYIEIREMIRTLTLTRLNNLRPIISSVWADFLRLRGEEALTRGFGLTPAVSGNSNEKDSLIKIRSRIAQALHPDIASLLPDSTQTEKEMLGVFFKWFNATTDQITKPGQR